MRTIGVLGGMTWHSTADYYRIINTRVREELGGAHSARMLISSVDQAAIADMDHFIDAVGELIAAVVDVDLCLGVRKIPPVHIGNARHRCRPVRFRPYRRDRWR